MYRQESIRLAFGKRTVPGRKVRVGVAAIAIFIMDVAAGTVFIMRMPGMVVAAVFRMVVVVGGMGVQKISAFHSILSKGV
jgi:hypothetical protein